MNERAQVTRAPSRWRLPALAVVVIAIAALLFIFLTGTKPAPVSAAVPVLVRLVTDLNRSEVVVVSGDIEASRSANVGFQVPGRVVRVWPEEGDFVQAGQPLAQLDTTQYKLQLVMASAAARQAEDQFKRLQQMNQAQGIAPADFVKIETGLEQARAQQALVRDNLANTQLVAPISGTVAHRGIEVGEQAAPGMPVFTIIATDPIQVRAGVPEAEIGRIKFGQTVEIRVPALPNNKFYGQVRLVGVAADPTSRTYSVKISVPNPRRLLRPGMIAEARIKQDSQVVAFTIPATAVVRDADGATQVFIYNPAEKKVFARRITVGTMYGKEVEVTSGLNDKDLVVVGGQHRVREGAKVDATTDKETAIAVEPRRTP